jgi:hypothetical protein
VPTAAGGVQVHQHLPRLLLGTLAEHPLLEVYPSLDAAGDDANTIATSRSPCWRGTPAAYGTAGYEQSLTTLSQVSLRPISASVTTAPSASREPGRRCGRGFTVELTVPV